MLICTWDPGASVRDDTLYQEVSVSGFQGVGLLAGDADAEGLVVCVGAAEFVGVAAGSGVLVGAAVRVGWAGGAVGVWAGGAVGS